MAVKTRTPRNTEIDHRKIREQVLIPEAYLVGLFWSKPDNYSFYPEERITRKMFQNKVWSFYFGLGRKMYDDEIVIFDDISVMKVVKDLGVEKQFDEYGGFETVYEIMEEVEGREDNLEAYYREVKKYNLLSELYHLLGDRVYQNTDKYNYENMSALKIATYWEDKLNSVLLNNESPVEEYDLIDGMEELIEEMDTCPDIGMPLHNSPKLNDIFNGWGFGTITLLSGFSGNGKTSFAIEKLLLGCIENSEKLVIMANEMSLKDFRKMLLISVMGSAEFYERYQDEVGEGNFNRKNINKGNFTDEEKKRLYKAVEWIKEHVGKKKGLIKFVPLESYTIENVERTMRYFNARGYRRMLLDTAKPTEGQGNKQRWEVFVQDFERLYKIVRPEGGGLNIALFCTIQAADEALKDRFLDERCIADGRKIKNVCDTVFHLRPVWGDEYTGENKELEVFYFKPSPTGKYEKQKVKLKKDYVYYLLFTSKNRRGQSNLTGLDVLVYMVNFNTNKWQEIGWTKVAKDNNY